MNEYYNIILIKLLADENIHSGLMDYVYYNSTTLSGLNALWNILLVHISLTKKTKIFHFILNTKKSVNRENLMQTSNSEQYIFSVFLKHTKLKRSIITELNHLIIHWNAAARKTSSLIRAVFAVSRLEGCSCLLPTVNKQGKCHYQNTILIIKADKWPLAGDAVQQAGRLPLCAGL